MTKHKWREINAWNYHTAALFETPHVVLPVKTTEFIFGWYFCVKCGARAKVIGPGLPPETGCPVSNANYLIAPFKEQIAKGKEGVKA